MLFSHTGSARTARSKSLAKIRGGDVDVLGLMKFSHSELPFDRPQSRVFNTLPKTNVYKWSVMGAVMKCVIV